MTRIKLALCQMNVVDNKEENIKTASLMIEKSVSKEKMQVSPSII